jgi:uncharacterized protein YdeI (YjbR/CyaY-like superfamily)
MAKRDPRIDAYIAKSPDFAKPILEHIVELVHAGCPDVVEAIKWSAPHFMYHGMFCGMASFKSHCAFGFWNRALKLSGKEGAMGQFGRITALSDLPADKVMIGYMREAARLNESGVKRPAAERRARKPLPMPSDLKAALGKNKKARAAFEDFSPSHRREYIEWITKAKTDATRNKRLTTAIGWMAQKKPRNWKYS